MNLPDADAKQNWKHGDNGANVNKESLGTRTINGVAAAGTRYTRTIPAGQIGNDKPLTIVKEEWYSPDLQIMVQIKHTDPFTGDTTYTVNNIQRTAPNTALFSVPSDYTVSDAPIGRRGGKCADTAALRLLPALHPDRACNSEQFCKALLS